MVFAQKKKDGGIGYDASMALSVGHMADCKRDRLDGWADFSIGLCHPRPAGHPGRCVLVVELLGETNMRVWQVVLAVYLILCGLYWLVPGITFPAQGIITGALAIVAAILLLMDRSMAKARWWQFR